MNYLGIILIMLTAQQVFAASKVNLEDKKEVFKILNQEKTVGTVNVESKFIGTPIIESTKITFSIECEKEYKLNAKLKKQDSFAAYDYGANGKLATFNVDSSELTIFYRTATIADGSPVIDKEKTFVIDLSKACTK